MLLEIIIFTIAGVGFAIALPLSIRRSRRAGRRVLCDTCYYDLGGLDAAPTSQCPECGAELASTGVLSVEDFRAVPKPREPGVMSWVWIAIAVLCVWLSTVPLYVLKLQCVAFIESTVYRYTYGPMPASFGTLTVETHSIAVRRDSRATADEADAYGPMLENRAIATSSVAGSPALDLYDQALDVEGIRSWLLGIDPTLTEPALRDASIEIALNAPSCIDEAETLYSSLPQNTPLAVQVLSVSVELNGVPNYYQRSSIGSTSSLSIRERLQGELGTPSLRHSTWRHLFRSLGVLGLVLLPVACILGYTRGRRWLRRYDYRKWLAGEIPREPRAAS